MLLSDLPETWLSPKTLLKKSEISGMGRFAGSTFHSQELVAIFQGRIVETYKLSELSENYSYLPVLNTNLAIAFSAKNNFNASSINHSCRPNLIYNFGYLYTQKYVEKNVELTLDYSAIGFPSGIELIKECLCRDLSCRGKILSL